MYRLMCLGLLSVACAGCSSLGLKKPEAAITGMKIQRADAAGLTLNFDVEVSNPNSVALPVTGVEYALSTAGQQVLAGKADPQGSVPANGVRRLVLPVTLSFEDLLSAGQAIGGGGGDIPYVIDGALLLSNRSSLLGSLRVPLRYSGTLELRSMLRDPAVLLRSPAARKLAERILGVRN